MTGENVDAEPAISGKGPAFPDHTDLVWKMNDLPCAQRATVGRKAGII